jgi:glycosyltransferase involved in cell wall biosynthesis
MFKLLLLKNGRNPNAGVARSATIISSALKDLGNSVDIAMEPNGMDKYDIVWVYGWFHANNGVSGKGRDVGRLIKALSGDGPPVLFNAAYNGKEERAQWILKILEKYPRAIAVVWTALAEEALGLHPRVLRMPKAFRTDIPEPRPLSSRQEYCIGDIADFGHSHITGKRKSEIEDLIESIQTKFPNIKISGYLGWSTRIKSFKGVDNVSRNRGALLQFLARQRGLIHLGPYESFAMTLMEAQSVGTPVIYPRMPQSITEYIGTTGLPYRTSSEIFEAIKVLENPSMWKKISEASLLNAKSKSAELHGPILHYAINCAINCRAVI